MKKIVLIPDSFKGSMSSAEICAIAEIGVSQLASELVETEIIATCGIDNPQKNRCSF